MPCEPVVSIVTCFLNMERYIAETIDSVLAQRYPHWELLLIDDGSTDGSTAIAKRLAERHPRRIRYLQHDGHVNRGASASRNLGIAQASGTYLTFLDADDVLLPEMLLRQVALMRQHRVAMISEASEYWYDWAEPARANVVIPVGVTPDRTYAPPALLTGLYPLGEGAAPCICGLLLDTAVLRRHGGFEERFPGMYDDQTLLVRFYLHETVFISSTCNNRYRQRPESLVHSSHSSGSYLDERSRFMGWLKQYLAKQGVRYPQVDMLLAGHLKSLAHQRRRQGLRTPLRVIKRLLGL